MSVSVIVTSFNYAEFLDDCLASIRNQTFKDYELIFIDDGSSDNSFDIASKYFPDMLIRSIENKGVVKVNNYGVAVSSGEYVCFVNADDVIESTYLEKCVEILDNNPKVAIAYTDFWHFGNGLDNGVAFPEYTLEGMKNWNFMLGSSMFRKIAFNQVGGFSLEMQQGMEDYDLWLSICESGWDAKHIPEYLYKYRCHNKNRTNSMDIGSLRFVLWKRHGMENRVD